MKKEVAIAIFIGLILGLVVTFGIYTARKSSDPSVEKSAELLASNTPGTNTDIFSSTNTGSLVLSTPEDGTITSAKEVQVSGTTLPDSFVFVFSADQYKLEKADGTGNFSTKIATKNGPMVILVRSIDKDGQAVEEIRSIFVGNPDEEQLASPVPSTSPKASPTTTKKVSTGSAQPR